MGLISKRLKQVLVLLDCSTFDDMIALSEDTIKVDYIEKSHKLKDELFKAISDIDDLKGIIPEFAASIEPYRIPHKVKPNRPKNKKFKVGDFTEELLAKSDKPISQHDLLNLIKEHLPDTYIESIRANLNGDPQKRFVFFLDGYVGNISTSPRLYLNKSVISESLDGLSDRCPADIHFFGQIDLHESGLGNDLSGQYLVLQFKIYQVFEGFLYFQLDFHHFIFSLQLLWGLLFYGHYCGRDHRELQITCYP